MLHAAAGQRHAGACMQLCDLELDFGSGDEEALKWYRRGRELGHPHDPLSLGILSRMAKGGLDEDDVARVERRAHRGSAADQYEVGVWHADDGDMAEAYRWFALASRHAPGNPIRPAPWGTPLRAVRLLEQVQDEDERKRAHRLVDEYERTHRQQAFCGYVVRLWRRLRN